MRIFFHRHLVLKLIGLLILAPHFTFSEHKQPTDNPPIITILPLPISGLGFGNYTWTSTEDSITIPLRRVGRIYLIEAEVDGEKGYLVFDTGASGIVLNKTYFRNHLVTDSQNSNGISGSIANVERIKVDALEIFGLKYKGVIADITNLGHIENRRGVKVLGLFGFSMLKDFEIIFNPSQNQLQLFKIDKKGMRVTPSDEKFNADFTTTFEFSNSILFIKANISGKNLRFCFDTGAETNVIDRYAPKSVLNCITITRRSSLVGAGSSSAEVLFGTMNGLQFGPKKMDNMETIITNLDPLSEAYGTKIDGMLGYSFISKGVIYINFVKNVFAIQYLKANDQ